MRTRVKLFYRAPWEAGFEVEEEYRNWLQKYDNGSVSTGYQFVARQLVGNWLKIWFHADKEID